MDSINQAVRKYWQVSKDIKISGLEWQNDKPIALLAHANGFCADTWIPVARYLAPHYHVVAFDFRGHGKSSTPNGPQAYQWRHLMDDMLSLIEQLLAEKQEQQIALTAGNSLGGVISAAVASEKSSLFKRVVMLDPPIVPSAATVERLGLALNISGKPQGPNLGDMARKRRAIWPSRAIAKEKWQNKPMFARWNPEAFQHYLQAGFTDRPDGTVELSCPPEVEAAIFDHTGGIDIFERAKSINCPLQIVHASNSHFTLSLYEEFARLCPQGQA
ncbi:MAG: alpha/beta hydrolase, partial [Pseudomonadales bacterium]|nr:alpha/beta hydrolase [Pseudomonadales bacterium]